MTHPPGSCLIGGDCDHVEPSKKCDEAFAKLVGLLQTSAYTAGASGGNAGVGAMGESYEAIIESYARLEHKLDTLVTENEKLQASLNVALPSWRDGYERDVELSALEMERREIARLRTTLRGISTCSTCEACRGAATLALGCPACQGNDGDMPCAYPSEGKPGCLRDKRLAQSPWRSDPVIPAYEWVWVGSAYSGGYSGPFYHETPKKLSDYANADCWCLVAQPPRPAQPPPVAHNSDWCPSCQQPYIACRCNGVAR